MTSTNIPENILTDHWDAIIVGAGHNGLCCAAKLARHKKKILVLESRSEVGGACTMKEPFPGYKISPCAYVAGLLHPKVIQEFDLPGHGFKWMATDGMFVPFDDGTSIHIQDDDELAIQEIRKIAPRDVAGWQAMHDVLIRATEALRPDNDQDMWLGDPPSRQEVEDRLKGDKEAIALVFEWSIMEYVEKYLEDERLQQAYIGQGIIGANCSAYEPGTASIYFYHYCGRMGKYIGQWGFVKGGMGNISFILRDIAKELGVTIVCNAPVSKILPGKGVLLSYKETENLIEAPIIISNADPQITRQLLDNEADSNWVKKVNSIPIVGSTVKMNFALEHLPNFKSRPGTDNQPQSHHYAIFNSPLKTKEAWQQSFDAAKAGHISDILWTENYFQSLHDPNLQPSGKHTMSTFCQYAPYKFSEGSWDDHREDVAGRIINSVGRFCNNFSESIIQYEVLGPPDIEKKVGLTGGHIFHGEMLPQFMWDQRLAVKTPMDGVYLCGSSTHPGGGVVGINGYNAAVKILSQETS